MPPAAADFAATAIINSRFGVISRAEADVIAKNPEVLKLFNLYNESNIKASDDTAGDILDYLSKTHRERTETAHKRNEAINGLGGEAVDYFAQNDVSLAYAQDFKKYFDAGVKGIGIDAANKLTKSKMPGKFKYDAYKLGQRAMDKNLNRTVKRASTPGFDYNSKYGKDVSNETKEVLDKLGRALGINITFGPEGDVNGSLSADGTLTIFEGAENPVLCVLTHELTHDLAANAPTEFKAFVNYVTNVLRKNGTDVDMLIDSMVKKRKGTKYAVTRAEALEEIMADYAGKMMNNTALFESFAKERPKAANKVLQFFKNLIAKIRRSFNASKSAQSAGSEISLRQAKKALKLWESALERARTNQTNAQASVSENKNTSDISEGDDVVYDDVEEERYSAKNGAQYDYSKPFDEQIDDYINGVFPQRDSLIVCGTPKVLQDIGFNALPVTYNQGHLRTALDSNSDADHRLGKQLLIQLPNSLKDPIAVIKSDSIKGRAVVILNFRINGHNIIAPFEVDGNAHQNNITIDSNAIATAFGKKNAITKLLYDAIQNELTGETSLFYWNKKRALSLLQAAGLQLSGNLPQDGSIHSIRKKYSPVKPKLENVTESQQFKRWFGDWKNNPKKASKVVDDDGKPLIVYHGTDGIFNTFDISKGRANMDIQGAFFSPYKDDAKGYGKNVYACYLNIRNPANEGTAFKVLNMFKGQNNAGVKARDYLIKQGYDGVYNGYDEYIAFYPEQIKSATDNIGTFDKNNPDIRYSVKESALGDENTSGVDNFYNEKCNIDAVNALVRKKLGRKNYKELNERGLKYLADTTSVSEGELRRMRDRWKNLNESPDNEAMFNSFIDRAYRLAVDAVQRNNEIALDELDDESRIRAVDLYATAIVNWVPGKNTKLPDQTVSIFKGVKDGEYYAVDLLSQKSDVLARELYNISRDFKT